MPRLWRSALWLAAALLAVQIAGVFLLWKERFESGAVIQMLPASHLDFSEDVCNVETIRSLLEAPDLAAEVKARFGLDKEAGWTARPLIERRFQESDPALGTFRFRFRHPSPDVACGVVQALLEGVEARWQAVSRARARYILEQDAQVLDMNLGQFDRQLASMSAFRIIAQPASGSLWAGILPTFVGASPHFEETRYQQLNLARRRSEIAIMLGRPGGSPDPVPRWRVVVPPVVATRPVWPSRLDLLVVCLLNSLLWAGAWALFRHWNEAHRESQAASPAATATGCPSRPPDGGASAR